MSEEPKKSKRNIKPFNGDKYSIWKFRVRARVAEDSSLNVLDEESPNDRDEDWNACERIAKGIIIEHLDDSMIGFATEHNTAREIFKQLDAIYERKSLAAELAAEKKLLSCKFKGDIPLAKHFMIVDEMIIELHAARCKLNEMSKVARLLLTLPNSYDAVVTAIQTMNDENLSLAFVKTRLLDYEIKLKSEASETTGKVLHSETINHEKNGKQHWKNHRQNSNRPKPFSRHPQNKFNNQRGLNKNNGNNKMKCDFCGRRNHTKKNCFFYYRTKHSEEQRGKSAQSMQVQEEKENFAFMSWTGAPVLNNNDKLTFVLDSGATDHIVTQLNNFTTVKDLNVPVKISIAKRGETITALKRGEMSVISNLGVEGVLENVLYAPDAPHNLLSVARI
uniref:Retrovirus-related Pol polyprotein from transposon TNT 1-94-like beta-barrel domain-containing protein n=1 Tax=Bracon brevicornis TaxID=1563983 RepID=A0A6V7JQH5_9HYME